MSLDDTDEKRKKVAEIFHRTLTDDDVRKQAEAFGFELEIDDKTEIACLWRIDRDSKESWSVYRGHISSISPWLHGYAICAVYMGHL